MAHAKAPSDYLPEYRNIMLHFAEDSSPLEISFDLKMDAEDLRQDLYRYFRSFSRFLSNSYYSPELRLEWSAFDQLSRRLRMSVQTTDPLNAPRGPCKLVIAMRDSDRAIIEAIRQAQGVA